MLRSSIPIQEAVREFEHQRERIIAPALMRRALRVLRMYHCNLVHLYQWCTI